MRKILAYVKKIFILNYMKRAILEADAGVSER